MPSSELFFPICYMGHWFLFIVDIANHCFVYLDSLYSEDSSYHLDIKDRLVSNFKNLWRKIVPNAERTNFNNFMILYPPVPKQTNLDDCGVFVMKCIELWHYGADLQNYFSHEDIPNIRMKYANGLYFSLVNQVNTSLVIKLCCGGRLFFTDNLVTCYLFLCHC
uniref:Ubiquitin-like protease family profile domain-containing protein n=1 Tax=Oryza punctata TaxID=4537 RepID=A0A0E0K120_ORYPU